MFFFLTMVLCVCVRVCFPKDMTLTLLIFFFRCFERRRGIVRRSGNAEKNEQSDLDGLGWHVVSISSGKWSFSVVHDPNGQVGLGLFAITNVMLHVLLWREILEEQQ